MRADTTLDALRALPAPDLFSADPALLKPRLVEWFEAATGRTLYPAQVEMYLIDMLTYLWSLLATEGNLAHIQRYAALASGIWLDQIGVPLQVPRLPAAPALTTVRFTLAAASASSVVVPAGTRVSAGTEATTFILAAAVIIAPGVLSADGLCLAATAGPAANGLLAGQMSTILDPVAGVATVANLTTSAGGADIEGDNDYRLRVCNALDKANKHGTLASYRENAFAVSPAIIDVGVVRPQPCYIDIYLLTASGAASAELNAQVLAWFDPETRRPMGDLLTMKQAVARTFNVPLTVVARRDVSAEALAVAQTVVAKWRATLGPLIAPETIRSAVRAIAGVINVETPGLAYAACAEYEYAVCTGITITLQVVS